MPKFNEHSALLLKIAIDSGIWSPVELANIMGNAAVETTHFTRMHEDLRYRSVDRLVSQVQSAAKRYTRDEIQAAIDSKDPRQIATVMYEGRDDLGNTERGDGWRFHGRGYFQYTGRENYTTYGKKFGVDLANDPDIAAEPLMAAKLAIAYWKDKVPDHMRDDPLAAGRKINGGPNGADARVVASQQWSKTITPELVHGIQSGVISLEQLAAPSAQSGEKTVTKELQKNLNQLGITDSQGQDLTVDGNRGGPNSRTNQAIASFQRTFGLEDHGLSTAELLTATQAALNANPLRNLEQTLRDIVPDGREQSPRPTVNGMPDYLLPRRNAPDQAAAAPHVPSREPSAPRSEAAPATSGKAVPIPAVEQLQFGDRGAAVLALQENLRLLGARDDEGRTLKADSDYGSSTRQAVEQFQLWTGRDVTGIADKGTLHELRIHSQHAAWQQSLGIAPGKQLADNLQPASYQAGVAADLRAPMHGEQVQSAQPASSASAPLPFSDSRHPHHELYVDVTQRLEGKGQLSALSDERLNQIVGALQRKGYEAGFSGDVVVHQNHFFARESDLSRLGSHVNVDMNQPAPSLHQTMREAEAHELQLTQQQAHRSQHQGHQDSYAPRM